MSPSFNFNLRLSEQKTKSIYQGQVKYLLVTTDQGLKIQLPAIWFRPFVANNGIEGKFHLETDENNRLIQLEKI